MKVAQVWLLTRFDYVITPSMKLMQFRRYSFPRIANIKYRLNYTRYFIRDRWNYITHPNNDELKLTNVMGCQCSLITLIDLYLLFYRFTNKEIIFFVKAWLKNCFFAVIRLGFAVRVSRDFFLFWRSVSFPGPYHFLI